MKRSAISLIFVLTAALAPGCKGPVENLPEEELEKRKTVPVVQPTPSVEDTATAEIERQRIQIELVTTSDWADLYVLEQFKIQSFEIDSIIGEPTFQYGGMDKLTLEQPIGKAESGSDVGIVINYELLDGVASIDFQSQRGGLNENFIRIFDISNDEPVLLMEVVHDQVHDSGGIWEFTLQLEEDLTDQVVKEYGDDLVFFNGTILTMEGGAIAEAIAIKEGEITAVGSYDEVLDSVAAGAYQIDLQGHTIMPGFIDAHSHILNNPWRDNLEGGQQLLLSNGITTSAELFVEETLIRDLQALDQQGRLRVRLSLYPVHVDNCGNLRGDWYSVDFPVSREPASMLQIPGIKLFNDGGSCNAPAVSFEYPSGYGQGDLYFQAETLSEMIIAAQNKGYQVAIHGLGDRAIDANLTAIEIALDGEPNTFRHRIEHNTLLRDDMLARYSEIDPVALLFGHFPTCAFLGDTSIYKFLPPPDFYFMESRWRDLIDANPDVHFAWHSDTPYSIGPLPFGHMQSYLTRTEVREDGSVCEPLDWIADDVLTLAEVLPMMTIEGAYALHWEDEIGSLKEGKLADLIIISDNPFEVDPRSIQDIQVLMTMVGGVVEFCLPGYGDLCP